MDRRSLLLCLAATPAFARAQAGLHAGLHFPADFGAHPETRTEWWYATGSLVSGARLWGFQVTFFRSSTGVKAAAGSRFAPTQLLFAHAALTDLEAARLRHDQRIARSGFGIAAARGADTGLVLRDWQMDRTPSPADAGRSRYRARVASERAGFAFELQLDATQPVLLQGDAGVSKKGPGANQTSRYYSEPQLAVQGTLTLDGRPVEVTGRAWLDHEWSDGFMPPQAVGWDWIGMNLDDGSALTAFALRRADGSAFYAGGSLRRAGEAVRPFGPDQVTFTPGRVWESASSRARYPVEWSVATPAGRFGVRALLDDQELDSRGSSGAIYWEGLSDLLDDAGRRVGRGYLEMTGYAAALRL
ncbi:MAG TPA: carotenoid 1,2-hydratase [Burkholderiaceae bacterium]|nr:carotenoid 1,2-hydratase [Burkholderiaceae bacterium]